MGHYQPSYPHINQLQQATQLTFGKQLQRLKDHHVGHFHAS